jgi:signal transduction histidine kinase
MSIGEGLVVVRRDGRVEAVGAGAPSTWLGLDLAHAGVLTSEERARLAAWLDAPQAHGFAATEAFRTESGGSLAVVLVDALPVRRVLVPPADLVTRTMDVFVEQARSNRVVLRVRCADDLPHTIEVDPEKIGWVLATLVGNALRLLAKHGERREEGVIEVTVSHDRLEEEVVIAVRDNGPGMPPEIARWLFDPDPSTGRPVGLALVMVRDVLTAHRGRIEVTSALGKGATFTLRLPARAPS